MGSSWHVLDGALVSKSITSSVATVSNLENDGILRGTIIAGRAAKVADRMSETLPAKNDAKLSAVWPVGENGAEWSDSVGGLTEMDSTFVRCV